MALPYIAQHTLPEGAQEGLELLSGAISRSKELENSLGELTREQTEENSHLRHIYEVADRLRSDIKDAQLLVDRALAMSHYFVPAIESSYQCAGAMKAVNRAHLLYLKIGRARDV